jgi:2-iminobutanoate/2-iminopropanoate deaminase
MRTLLLTLVVAVSVSAAEKKVVTPKDFPAGRPYSAGLMVDGTLYVSGQVGQDWKNSKAPDDFEAEVRQALDNVGMILKAGGMDFSNVVAVQIYLTDMDLFPKMNGVYLTYFKEPRPTRTTVGVAKLVGTTRIEITVTAK